MKHSSTLHYGFTLVEVLIGLTLFSLILVMIFSGLYTSARSWDAGEKAINSNDEARLILSFLRKQINQAVPILYVNDRKYEALFNGENHSLRFVSRLPAYRGEGGLHLGTFSVIKNNNESVLTFNYRTLDTSTDPFNEPDEGSTTVTLIEHVDSIELEYFGNKKDDEDPRWYTEWSHESRLPDLVRFHILAEDNIQYWPELVITIPSQPERGLPELLLMTSDSDLVPP